jgi:diadenosine tetraphosphatase ApaH/serine/threonine PP2A family protein phosphatase
VKIAVVSDIHANLEAWEAVAADLEAAGAEEIYTLGDNVGYGPDPEAVLRALDRAGAASVMGNHELGLADPEMLGWFNPQARSALEKTRGLLSAESLAGLAGLPAWRAARGLRLVHGAPPDSPTDYLFTLSPAELAGAMAAVPEEVCLCGHTHELALWRVEEGGAARRRFAEGASELEPGPGWVANIGAVGQPRDGDPRAKYVLWEPGLRRLTLRKVAYDYRPTQKKIVERGLDPVHARRLGP